MTENIQKDLVLSINEYAYVLDETKGHVSCLVGPTKMSLSQSDKLVLFDPVSKSFIPCTTMDRAKNLFTTAPENWYVILKNPVEGNKHPIPGASNGLPENVQVGKKINITGPVTFALYPGQMAKVVRGHTLRSNQYLLARVYEANAANTNKGQMIDAEGNAVEDKNKYINGQILVIKGTEVSFYIPPTGIEVIAIDNSHKNGYVRDAVTLERLEYCILKDENGSKRYVHGPQVVFPQPSETFVTATKGGTIFKAIELSPISGIYVKVIAKYTDEGGVEHPEGEELFITGNDQMIYYPRPEHAIINYDGKVVHHAIAIPKGEGRYIMNRLTGEIKTVKGPEMYLPDPRFEVVVKRKLTRSQASLWYPGNREVLEYNESLSEKAVEKATIKTVNYDSAYSLNNYVTTVNCALVTDPFCLDQLESKASVSRGTSYTKPRTITLDNKFDGVVSIDVWNGYAVNVISKNGDSKVVVGPKTIILDYDQELEAINVNGEKTVFLPTNYIKLPLNFTFTTQDYFSIGLEMDISVKFNPAETEKWFKNHNFAEQFILNLRSALKHTFVEHTVQDIYNNYRTYIDETFEVYADALTDSNGLIIDTYEVKKFKIFDEYIADFLENEQQEKVKKEIELQNAEKHYEIEKELADFEIAELKEANRKSEARIQSQKEIKEKQIAANKEIEALSAEVEKAKIQAKADMQVILDTINAAELARKDAEVKQQLDQARAAADIEKQKQEAYANTVKEILTAIGPELAAALTHKTNADMLETVSNAVSPYALANGESLADTVNKLVRGTSLENVIDGVNVNLK